MGIEPTSDTHDAPLNGFEDRAGHQHRKHFRKAHCRAWVCQGYAV